jgi:hypothetical protein
MAEEVNNKFNTNARLFSKDQLQKILEELDIKPEAAKKPQVKPTVKSATPDAPSRLPQGDVEDILRQNFIEDDPPQEEIR